jgi:hypothetical protein
VMSYEDFERQKRSVLWKRPQKRRKRLRIRLRRLKERLKKAEKEAEKAEKATAGKSTRSRKRKHPVAAVVDAPEPIAKVPRMSEVSKFVEFPMEWISEASELVGFEMGWLSEEQQFAPVARMIWT